jgi:FkbM family methyltransferase
MENKDFQFDDLREIDRNQPLNIIEIGANNGETTEKLLEIFEGSKIYAFEPDERAINKFKKKFKDNKKIGRAHV